MRVSELRKALSDMPGEMGVYFNDGMGIASAKHIFRGNLIGVEQFCEIIAYGQEHTPPFEDSKIERETGFKNREELIAAYKALKSSEADHVE